MSDKDPDPSMIKFQLEDVDKAIAEFNESDIKVCFYLNKAGKARILWKCLSDNPLSEVAIWGLLYQAILNDPKEFAVKFQQMMDEAKSQKKNTHSVTFWKDPNIPDA